MIKTIQGQRKEKTQKKLEKKTDKKGVLVILWQNTQSNSTGIFIHSVKNAYLKVSLK